MGAATHRPDIEGLRGVAVLCVFAVHSVPDSVRGGFVGVDVFFVISGFLIASITLGAGRDPTRGALDFYRRRLRRLLPALLVVLLACLAFAVLLALPVDAKAIGKHMAAGSVFISNIALWSEAGYFDPSSELKPLLHLWSLGIEAQFYALWPLLAWLLLRAGRRAGWVVLGAIVISFSLNVLLVDSKPKAVFFLPPTRLWEMLVGVLLATWHLQVAGGPLASLVGRLPAGWRWRHHAADWMAGVGVLLLLLAITLTERTVHFPGWWAILPTVGTFMLLAAGMQARLNRALLAQPLLTFYGRISYPLYLWHWPLLTFPLLLDIRLGTMAQIGLLALAVGLGALTHYGVELPLRTAGGRRVGRWLLPAGLAFVAAAGGVLFVSDGLLLRYPEPARTVAAEQLRQDTTLIRMGSCFQNTVQARIANQGACTDTAPADAPLVVLWGDSFAAALYPGLRSLVDGGELPVRLAQITGPLCPPLLRASARGTPACPEMSRVALEQIGQLRPRLVILAGAWRTYAQQADGSASTDIDGLRDTVARLRALGVPRVVLVGSVPVWRTELPRLLLGEWRSGGEMPARMAQGLLPGQAALDEDLAALARASGADYVSALGLLCNASGCETLIADAGKVHPMAYDEAHLGLAGSRLLARRMLGSLQAGRNCSQALRPGPGCVGSGP